MKPPPHIETSPVVTLALTVHEPTDRLAGMVDAYMPALAGRYAALTAFCSRQTHPALLDALCRQSVQLQIDEEEPTGIDRIGEVRRKTIRGALLTGTPHLQMCDFDRALHWAASYPEEIDAVLAELAHYDLLVLGRTERAWATHPPYQSETEPLFNRVFALVTGLPWDVGAGSRGLSRRAAQALLEDSRELTVGIDAEWPLLLLKRQGYRVGYRPCEGLEFETADRYGPEIESAGSYHAWEAQMNADPRQWAFRLRVTTLIAEAAVRYGSGPQSR